MRQDEVALLRAIQGGKAPIDAVAELGIHPKRASYLFSKWSTKGWYEWGVVDDRGWLTDEGRTAPDGGPT